MMSNCGVQTAYPDNMGMPDSGLHGTLRSVVSQSIDAAKILTSPYAQVLRFETAENFQRYYALRQHAKSSDKPQR